MVELGLLRAQAAGYNVPFDLDELDAVAWRELEAGELTPGDIGLMLWIDARRAGGCGDGAGRLASMPPSGGERRVSAHGSGWSWGGSSPGLAHHVAAGGSRTGERLLADALDQLLRRNRAPSGLFRHFGDARLATTLPELRHADLFRVGPGGGRAPRSRRPCAARGDRHARTVCSRLQLTGWRLALALRCRARHGCRALRDLFGPSGRDGADGAARALGGMPGPALSSTAVARGLAWIHGGNELSADMVDRENGLVLRSIRRKRGPRPALGGSEDGRVARRPLDTGSDRSPDRDSTQPTAPTTSAGCSRPGADARVFSATNRRPRPGRRDQRTRRSGSDRSRCIH